MKIGLVVNPAAGNGRAARLLPHVIKALQGLFKQKPLTVRTLADRGDQAGLQLLGKGVEMVVCLGGDGTFNQLAQALAKTEVPVAYVPGGRGNDLVKSLFGQVVSWRHAVHNIANAKIREIDLGLVEASGIKRFFVNGFGAGFDAEVARKVNHLRPMSGLKAYFMSVFSVFRSYRPVLVDARNTAVDFKGAAFIVGAGIGKFMGGGFKMFPNADMRDGLVDFQLIEPISGMTLVSKIGKVIQGKHLGLRQVHYAQVKEAVFSVEKAVNAQLDGEVIAVGPGQIRISCVEKGLRVML